jgi:hypothetical protein
MDGTSAQPQVNLSEHLLDAGSIAAVDHGDEGVPAARPGLQLPGHGLVPAQISQSFTALNIVVYAYRSGKESPKASTKWMFFADLFY